MSNEEDVDPDLVALRNSQSLWFPPAALLDYTIKAAAIGAKDMEQRALAAEAALLSATKELDAARATNRDLVRAKSEAYAMGERAAEADLKTALEAVKADLVKEKEMVRIFASQAAGWSEDIQTAEEERDSALLSKK